MVSGLTNLIPLVLLPIIIVPGVVGLKIRLHVSHRTDSYGRLDSTVYSWTLSSISICLLYVWIYLATGSVSIVPDFYQANSISDLKVTTIVGLYLFHFIQCLAIGAFIGAFAYNYIDPPRLSVRETKRDLIFKHIGRGSNVEIRTEDGDTIRGYVGKSFNRGKGEGVILSGPKRVYGPEVDGEKYTEDMGEYALIKELNIAHVSVEGEGIEPEKTKDDPDKLQNLILGVKSEVFPSYSLQSLLSPPRRFFTYSLFLFLTVPIVGLLSSLFATHSSSITPAPVSFEISVILVSILSIPIIWFSNRYIWGTLVSKEGLVDNRRSVINPSLVILVPIAVSTGLFQMTGISRIKALAIGCLISCSAIYLGLKYRIHSQRVWGHIGKSEFYHFSMISLASQIFFLLVLSIFGRTIDRTSKFLINIDAVIVVLSFAILCIILAIFLKVIEGGPSKKRSLPSILQTPTITLLETLVISILLIYSIYTISPNNIDYLLLSIAGFGYSVGMLSANHFIYIYFKDDFDEEDQDHEPPKPAI